MASLAVTFVLARTDQAARIYLGTDTRAFALLVGTLAALLPVRTATVRRARQHPRTGDATVVLLMAGIAVLWWFGGAWLDMLLHGGLALHSFIAAGAVSLMAAITTAQWASPARDLAAIALSLALTEVSYRLVAQPIRRQTRWAAGRRADLATAASTTVAATVLWIGDSVAADMAPAIEARLAAAGVTVHDGALDGARLVPSDGIDPVTLYDEMMTAYPADVVVVQLMSWDSPFSTDDLRVAHTWFASRVRAMGADLVVVTSP